MSRKDKLVSRNKVVDSRINRQEMKGIVPKKAQKKRPVCAGRFA
ncbi:MAG: hypothetical protein ACI84C_000609 [Flavobacteriales bacterium]|jgi:hypothetical protein